MLVGGADADSENPVQNRGYGTAFLFENVREPSAVACDPIHRVPSEKRQKPKNALVVCRFQYNNVCTAFRLYFFLPQHLRPPNEGTPAPFQGSPMVLLGEGLLLSPLKRVLVAAAVRCSSRNGCGIGSSLEQLLSRGTLGTHPPLTDRCTHIANGISKPLDY